MVCLSYLILHATVKHPLNVYLLKTFLDVYTCLICFLKNGDGTELRMVNVFVQIVN